MCFSHSESCGSQNCSHAAFAKGNFLQDLVYGTGGLKGNYRILDEKCVRRAVLCLFSAELPLTRSCHYDERPLHFPPVEAGDHPKLWPETSGCDFDCYHLIEGMGEVLQIHSKTAVAFGSPTLYRRHWFRRAPWTLRALLARDSRSLLPTA